MAKLNPKQSLNKTYRQKPVLTDDFNKFKSAIRTLMSKLADGQREDTQKNILYDFLVESFYKPYYIAPEEDIDLAVHLDKTPQSPIGLLIEVKSTTNSYEMISNGNLNKKALQELLYYYLKERVTKKNNDIRFLIVTNIYEYFIFDAQEFERIFYSDKKLLREYDDFISGRKTGTRTDFFYSEIAAKYIAAASPDLEYTHFDLREFRKEINSDAHGHLIDIYKTFSDTHLLKLPFGDDSNHLNKDFYAELLHIMGIEEQKQDNKLVIVRKLRNERNEASLLESTIIQLDSEDCLDKINSISTYGENYEEQLFNVALELCITWINRILFLKLLEAQMLSYHNGNPDYRFLTIDKIHDFDGLNDLFFKVLARDVDARTESIKNDFPHVPYLNSSLFEKTELEKNTFGINAISARVPLPLLSCSILKKAKHTAPPRSTLEYLFRFLDAYDFASTGDGAVEDNDKTLINASVLGLIFEKINGHKDGSVFTPGVITMYMCREAISRTVIDKFNDRYGWRCTSVSDLYNRIDNISVSEANETFDNIKICDPAVGSGHFLVSALNEMIYLKYSLGILVDSAGQRIRKTDYTITIDNDELVISLYDGSFFSYIPSNPECQRIQETIFQEKRRIIEHSLFGVDINPNSVKICQLRLWIELLKNTYYTADSGYTQLETLPNIDINIKCGNSLLYRFDITDNIQQILHDTGISIAKYRETVFSYKNAPDKLVKREMNGFIHNIKTKLADGITGQLPEIRQLTSLRNQLFAIDAPRLIPYTDKELTIISKKRDKLTKDIQEIENRIEEKRSIYANALEWRIEYPELLDDSGSFIGFDCIIGNPPYIQLQKMGIDADALSDMKYQVFTRTGDIYCLFYELGTSLLRHGGTLCFITSNKWMRAGYGEALRRFLIADTDPLVLIDFAGTKIFDSATVDTNILLLRKSSFSRSLTACTVTGRDCLDKLGDFVRQNAVECSFSGSTPWVILSPIEQSIKRKIEAVGIPLKDWGVNIYRGVLTGYNDAFIISTEKRDEILANCQSEDERTRTAELIRPILRGRDIKRYGYEWADLYLIATFPSRHYDIEMFPAVKKHLLSFGIERLEQTGKTHIVNGEKVKARKKTNNEWFETQDSISYWDDFNTQQIVWIELSDDPKFAFAQNIISANTVFFLTGKHIHHLLGLLNSKLITWYFKHCIGTTSGVGTNRWLKYTIEQIPIVAVNAKLEDLVNKINEQYSVELDSLIDRMICHLYNLDENETGLIIG